MTWIERLQHDATLQAFVAAEMARGGLEIDTLRWQHQHDRRCIQTLTAQLDAAKQELKTARRRHRGDHHDLVDHDVLVDQDDPEPHDAA